MHVPAHVQACAHHDCLESDLSFTQVVSFLLFSSETAIMGCWTTPRQVPCLDWRKQQKPLRMTTRVCRETLKRPSREGRQGGRGPGWPGPGVYTGLERDREEA